MKKVLKIILSIVLLVVVFWVGLGVGYLPMYKSTKTAKSVLTTLSSGVVPTIAIYGQISKIDGKKVTLTYSGDSAIVNVPSSCQIFTLTSAGQQKSDFSSLKTGQFITINSKLFADGTLQGQTAIVLKNQ